MKVHETKSHAEDREGKTGAKKQKSESKAPEAEAPAAHTRNKRPKPTNWGRSSADVAAEFDEFCKATREHLSIEEMRKILEANNQDSSGSDDAVVPRCQDIMFYGPLEKCLICDGQIDCNGSVYQCNGCYSEWTTCKYSTRDPKRREDPLKLPDELKNNSMASDWIKNHEPVRSRELAPTDKPFIGMMISLSGRLTRSHQYWRKQIEKHGGKVSNGVAGVTCLVVSPTERERGGSSKVIEAMERSIPVVREAWLQDSIDKQEAQPLQAYDVVSDLPSYGKGIPLDKQDPNEEAIESLSAELKLYGKRGVYKDSKLEEEGGRIYERDGIIYNCAFAVCDQGRPVNDYCIMQLIVVPDNRLHLYYKKARMGDDTRAEERVEEKASTDGAVEEFARLFKDLTGNEFEPWEREKKFQKKPHKFFPIDMDDGIDVRHGGLGLRQLGIAALHCKLDPSVANFMKILCSQEIYRYAMMEMGVDSPDLPTGMLSNFHLKRCEEFLQQFADDILSSPVSDEKAKIKWLDFSNKWFTLLPSTRPFTIADFQELADHAASVLETVRDITVASHLIGDMTSSTMEDTLFDRYKNLRCSITPVEQQSEEYKMILDYLNKTYEPVKLGDLSYGVSVQNVFAVESDASPSFDEMKKLPNKHLLWCGTRSSNLLRHLHKGFQPAVCSIPVAGYMFGRGIVCSDAAAEAARYGFTVVDRPEGFLVLAVVSLGDRVTEMSSASEDTKKLESKKAGVKGLGRKKTDESEHFVWKDDVKVPCGRIMAAEHKESPLEYNEYTVYDPGQVSMRFLVGVKFDTVE